MKSVSGSLKLELATFEELSSFAQFSSDIDPETQKVIDHGNRLVELLKQPAYQIINHELIILSMYLSEYGWLDKLEVEEVRPFERYMQEAFQNNHSDLLDELAKDYKLTEDLQKRIDEVMETLLEDFKVMRNG